MDFVGGGGSGTGGLGSDNGPILYSEPNRTSAIDDIRSVVIYIFIITIIVGFLLILPGVRSEKIPTFLCITTSLIVTSIILVVLFGTAWHVGQAPISGPYKAFSKDRIQGELSIKIGLRSVNITLIAHKYYELHVTNPVPAIFTEDTRPLVGETATSTSSLLATIQANKQPSVTSRGKAKSSIEPNTRPPALHDGSIDSASKLAEELLADPRDSANEPSAADAEIEADEVFSSTAEDDSSSPSRRARSSSIDRGIRDAASLSKRAATSAGRSNSKQKRNTSTLGAGQKYTIERSNVDINYNERFYWIEPDQMRQEHHSALKRGLPYPILTVVEYLSQDEAGFSWSRQYRMAGYYSYIILWLSFCTCMLMFFLHCAAPKYGIYTMQAIGCLLLFTNFTYATLVPKGDRKLVIPFEGQSISLKFGWSYWLVLIGGCLSLVVGTLIVIIDRLFPNFIFTTILDVDFDSRYYRHGRRQESGVVEPQNHRPIKPPFLEHSKMRSNSKKPTSTFSSAGSDLQSSSIDTAEVLSVGASSTGSSRLLSEPNDKPMSRRRSSAIKLINTTTSSAGSNEVVGSAEQTNAFHLSELFVGPLVRPSASNTFSGSPMRQQSKLNSDSEIKPAQEAQLKRNSSVVEILENSDTYLQRQPVRNEGTLRPQNYYGGRGDTMSKSQTAKNTNLKTTDHLSRRQTVNNEAAISVDDAGEDSQVRL